MKKQLVYFGGMIWHTNKFFEHIKNLDMKELVFGGRKQKRIAKTVFYNYRLDESNDVEENFLKKQLTMMIMLV